MNNMRLHSFLLNDGLDVFVYMVMDALASHCRGGLSRVCGAVCLGSVSKLGSFSVESSPSLLGVFMMKFPVFDGHKIVVVLLGKSLLVSDRLNCGMMMILMNFLIQCSSHRLMLVRFDMFFCDMGSNVLVNGGLVLSILRKEARNGRLCFLHCG